ncbi:hypothetical protein PHYBOEH_005645 [Phytophthora boehmeriae]|uniref:RxLR effector protein n=1 Tax=Phytophthora boehmeriae TaxID=109152 RepID=A0A8T1WP47_9STRA|nr:hypothetical protein PHYBOEH_005645 [Phytophthora boehmeriae]
MRLHYILLVAAATVFVSVDGVEARAGSAQTTVSTTALSGLNPVVRSLASTEANGGNDKTFLRRSNEDDEDGVGEEQDHDNGDENEEEEERLNFAGLKKMTDMEGLQKTIEVMRREVLLHRLKAKKRIHKELADMLKLLDIKANDIAKMYK